MAEAAQYRRFRAPPDDGQKLVEPPRPALGSVVARNREHLAGIEYDLQGRSLAELTASARQSLVAQAVAYTSRYRNISGRHLTAARSGAPMILSGHQPQLVHPGVWYKNFLLGNLAAEVGGAAIHLLIDSDLCRSASIRVPAGSLQAPYLESVPFDHSAADVPYEQRFVLDETIFTGFAKHVSHLLKPFSAKPLVEELWPLVLDRSDERTLGLRIAQGRHLLEATLGNDTLELPQSDVCRLPEFHWFVAHLLAHLPRFWAAYNDALAAYRVTHHLRNRAHPIPDLAQNEGWLEAPFWMWSDEDPHRRAVFARQRAEQLDISDFHGHTMTLTLSADRDADLAAEQLAAAAGQGVKLRTRALATTLFARLLVSDLFLHGIGGAKYDQVTDDIAGRFFGFALPEYASASATLRLPIVRAVTRSDRLRDVRHQLRELAYHPEQYLGSNRETPAASHLLAKKRRSLKIDKTSANALTRHQAILAANAALQPLVAPRRAELLRERTEIERQLAVDSILSSREYSFCLFPREHFLRLLRE